MRGNFAKRDEHKRALLHPGMRNSQTGRLEGEIAEDEQIDVDIPRAFVDDLFAAHGAFDGLRAAEDLSSEVFRPGLDDHVQEAGLIEDVGRFGFDDRTAADDFDTFGREAGNRVVEESLAITEI